MNKKTIIKYLLYLVRWQLSTPILAIVLIVLSDMGALTATIIANLIGGLIFFWIDKIIFKKKIKVALWEFKEDNKCCDCGQNGLGYRIVIWNKYDKTEDQNPKFRCKRCSEIKAKSLKGDI